MTAPDARGRDTLHYADADGDVATVLARLDAGVDIDLADRKAALTPLYFAVERGASTTASLLLERGADHEARSRPRRMTPLIYAVLHWRRSLDGTMIRLLLEHGSDPGASDKNGHTARDVAQGMLDVPPAILELLAAHD